MSSYLNYVDTLKEVILVLYLVERDFVREYGETSLRGTGGDS